MDAKQKNKDKVKASEAFRLSYRAFMLWWNNFPEVFASITAFSIVNALTPYVGIYLSARIIGELAGGRDPRKLFELVTVTLIATAFLTFLKGVLERWKKCEFDENYFKEEKLYLDKLLNMDFCVVDDPKTYELHSQLEQEKRWSGWGVGKLCRHFEDMLTAIFQIGGAVVLTASLFYSRVPEAAGNLVALNRPEFVLLMAGALLAGTLLAPALSNRGMRYWADGAEENIMGNRLFSFFGFAAYEQDRTMDMRMYRQEKICHDALAGDMAFGVTGLIAKRARGPMGLLMGASAAVSHALSGLIYLFVCLKAWAGAFGVGYVAQYIGSITALARGISLLVATWGDMRNNAVFLRHSFAFLDIPNEMYQGSLTVEKRADRNYEIEFQDVSFCYPGSEAWALRHVSLKFQVGSHVAVVGQNGSGKTTFIKLLCRLYDPTEGRILLNGIDIRKYDYREYQSVFSVVFQDFQLLALTLGENVAADMEFDAERVRDCLVESGFGDKLEKLQNGLNTYLYRDFDDQGVDVSGGEAQKIAIARALYKDAPFMILDEPTAALDPIAEAEIYAKFHEIVGDKTAVYISHRLSSCRFCDEILVFDQGQVIQQGTHEALVAEESGKYHELWEAQAQYYRRKMA